MAREFRLTMTQESINALGMIIYNYDRGLSLYPIVKSSELMPYCLLTNRNRGSPTKFD